jgi:hypothetical protein
VFAALRALPDAAALAPLLPFLQPEAAAHAEAPDTVPEMDEPAANDTFWPEPDGDGGHGSHSGYGSVVGDVGDLDDVGDDAAAPWPQDEPVPPPRVPGAPVASVPAAMRVLPRGHHVYGAKAALRVEEDRWRTDDPVRCHTLRLEVAPALAERRYDWEHKIAVQLTARELPAFAAVMLNLLPHLQAQGHGFANDKWFELRRQSGGVLVRVGQGRRGSAVPVTAGDLYELTLLALDALKANAPQADTAQVMAALQSLAG